MVRSWCSELKALILAGGYATRLRPLSYALPKLLFPVGGRPLLEQTVSHLASFGVGEVVLAVNYLAEQLRDHFGEEYGGVKIKYSLEPKPLGTGGPIAFARHHLDGQGTFVVMNGDILSEVDLKAMREVHESSHALATIALHEVEDPTRFGVARLGERSRILEFIEKPKMTDATGRLVNAGVYLMEPDVIDRVPTGRKVVIEREIFPALADEGKLFGYVHPGAWFDIGNIADFKRANFAVLENKPREEPAVALGATVAASVQLTHPVLMGDRANVEDGVRLGPRAIIGDRTLVRRNAKVAETIVFDDAEIGSGSSIEGAVVANSVVVGRNVVIQEGSVIAGHVTIHDNVQIARDVHVHPYKEISRDILTAGHVV